MGVYKRLERKLVHRGKITTVYTDLMQLPDGRTAEWDFIEHHGAAAFVAETQEGMIVMVRQYRNALERDTLEIPAGGVNEGEEFRNAAVRELQEETGYQATQAHHLLDLYTTVAFCNEKIGIYCGMVSDRAEQCLDADEYVDIELYPLDVLISFIMEGKIQDSKTISALLTYKQYKEMLD